MLQGSDKVRKDEKKISFHSRNFSFFAAFFTQVSFFCLTSLHAQQTSSVVCGLSSFSSTNNTLFCGARNTTKLPQEHDDNARRIER